MDRFSTHLNLLSRIFDFLDIKTSLEFGMGEFSTSFLLNRTSDKVTSIEMQHQQWFNKINAKFSTNDKWKGILSLGANSVFGLDYEDRYDFILVDGHGESRPECVNFSSKLSDVIVAHDTEATDVYGWGRVNLPDHYCVVDKDNEPWTTVWTKNKDLYNFLNEKS